MYSEAERQGLYQQEQESLDELRRLFEANQKRPSVDSFEKMFRLRSEVLLIKDTED